MNVTHPRTGVTFQLYNEMTTDLQSRCSPNPAQMRCIPTPDWFGIIYVATCWFVHFLSHGFRGRGSQFSRHEHDMPEAESVVKWAPWPQSLSSFILQTRLRDRLISEESWEYEMMRCNWRRISVLSWLCLGSLNPKIASLGQDLWSGLRTPSRGAVQDLRPRRQEHRQQTWAQRSHQESDQDHQGTKYGET